MTHGTGEVRMRNHDLTKLKVSVANMVNGVPQREGSLSMLSALRHVFTIGYNCALVGFWTGKLLNFLFLCSIYTPHY